MEKIARTDWKRHSAPYDFPFDYTQHKSSVSEMFDQAMEAFTEETTDHQRSATLTREKKKTINNKLSVFNAESAELSTDQYTPGVLKVFGETILPGVQYKSVLASCRSTAQELVKQALERFGLPPVEYRKFVLCDVVGRYEFEQTTPDVNNSEDQHSGKWERIYARILSDRDKPLLLQKFWKPIDKYSRRYELHERAHVTDSTDDDDTSGLNKNARKILMSKLRPGAIPLFDASKLSCHSNGLSMDYSSALRSDSTLLSNDFPDNDPSTCKQQPNETRRMCSEELDFTIPTKHPFFVNVRGFDVLKDRTMYVIKWKQFTFGNPSSKLQNSKDDVPKFNLYAPDIDPVHCNFKVYRFKKSNGLSDPNDERNNYFLELNPLVDNVCVNGHKIHGKTVIKSGDILNIGIYYALLFKDCSKGFDVPLALPWQPIIELSRNSDSESDNCDLRLNLRNADDESKSNTDESMDASIAERMSFAYTKDKEEELVKYICAIIQQQNTCQTYALTVAFLFSMCIEYASRNFDRRQLKHLFLRILFTVRENVAETAKSLSASKFTCTLLDATLPPTERDQKLQRLLLWKSNCVQLLLFLKHTFQLPELPLSDRGSNRGRSDKSPRKEDSAKHALGQLVTGLEEIIMFCFQQCVYTVTKSLHPTLSALLNSNPFSDANSEESSMEDIIRMFEALAEVTHSVMLHESITRQLFTYLFFFTNTNIFNKLMVEESGIQYFNWQSGVRVRANLSQLEDWATQNGLEDEFGQMFERLLAASELLATSKNTLVKYQWHIMKTHYQPLTHGQLYHLLTNYHLGSKTLPVAWTPPGDELEAIEKEAFGILPLSTHPPFALPDNCGVIDLVRTPEDTSFWNHLRRLKALYGVAEDDSDSGFSISNTPRGSSSIISKPEMGEPFFEQETSQDLQPCKTTSENQESKADSALSLMLEKQKSRIPVKKCNTNPWSFKVPKTGTGVCKCASFSRDSNADTETVSLDLMKEERRENADAVDTFKDPNNIIAAMQSKSIKINLCSKPNKTDRHVSNKYPKNNGSNVADCSARVHQKSNVSHLQPRERSNSTGVAKQPKARTKIEQVQSFSLEDINLPLRLLKRKPSASFEEAIQRGYESERHHQRMDSVNENDVQSKSIRGDQIPQSNILSRQMTTESASCDDVFIDENTIDKLYTGYHSDLNAQTLPNIKSRKSCVKSSSNHNRSYRTPSQKMMAVSFDSSTRVSSIELTKDDLFLNCVDEVYCDQPKQNSVDIIESGEAFPVEMFTEVSESTLAALKRHGSSLNVAPSCENSPRTPLQTYEHSNEASCPDDKKAMSPCPLLTVYLKKGEAGLGLGLIDGLHTPLRLAGIYIRKILPKSPAAVNGCLQVGDRILAVCGKSVIGADYHSTMSLIKEAGDTLTLLVARGNDSMAAKVSASQI